VEGSARKILPSAGLNVGLGFGQAHHAAALFPHAALFEQVDPLETLENVALGCNGTGGTKAAML
jgi:hypothetical protein